VPITGRLFLTWFEQRHNLTKQQQQPPPFAAASEVYIHSTLRRKNKAHCGKCSYGRNTAQVIIIIKKSGILNDSSAIFSPYTNARKKIEL